MKLTDGWNRDSSPFHAGEMAVQQRLGVRDKIESFGRRVIRPFMPQQHRDFFGALPLVFVGHVDRDGRPWASVLVGGEGFISSPDATTLMLDAAPFRGDPLAGTLCAGASVGLLGMNAANRRRNRVNGKIVESQGRRITFRVEQSFGNCPQYIQTRSPVWQRDPSVPNKADAISILGGLDDPARAMISAADTFFVATASANGGQGEGVNGADVSHRGGKPGFVRIDGNILTIPDYPGNLHYNTLGNIEADPRAGLLFIDYDTGDVLMLTGAAEVVWDGPEVAAFRGAERLWRLKIDQCLRLPKAMPMRWEFGEYSPNMRFTGDWEDAAANMAAEAKRESWRPYRVVKVVDESDVIRSYHLQAADGDGMFAYAPGQFLTIRANPGGVRKPVIRTYTLSSAPNDRSYRISVKREDPRGTLPAGVMSNHLYATLKADDIIEAKAPKGKFCLDTAALRPAVLLAGGGGITPMIAMARQAASEGLRKRYIRPLTVIHAAQTTADRAFAEDFRALETATEGRIRYVSVIERPAEGEVEGRDYDAEGYVTANLLRWQLALDDYDFFLCGPPPFMQAVYNALRSLGVRDARIFAEAFGPASLARTTDAGHAVQVRAAEADQAVVSFAASGFEQRWNKGDAPLLMLAEEHGLAPDFGCRSGSCGACAVKIRSGAVTYRSETTASVGPNEALICCAVPASERVELEL